MTCGQIVLPYAEAPLYTINDYDAPIAGDAWMPEVIRAANARGLYAHLYMNVSVLTGSEYGVRETPQFISVFYPDTQGTACHEFGHTPLGLPHMSGPMTAPVQPFDPNKMIGNCREYAAGGAPSGMAGSGCTISSYELSRLKVTNCGPPHWSIKRDATWTIWAEWEARPQNYALMYIGPYQGCPPDITGSGDRAYYIGRFAPGDKFTDSVHGTMTFLPNGGGVK